MLRQAALLHATGSAGQVSSTEAGLALPPHLEHAVMITMARDRVDTLRRCIHALDAQRVLVFMNFQQRLKVCWFACVSPLRCQTSAVTTCALMVLSGSSMTRVTYIPAAAGLGRGAGRRASAPSLRVQDTQFKLQASGMRVACLHGELGKMERQAIMRQFCAGEFRALVGARRLGLPVCLAAHVQDWILCSGTLDWRQRLWTAS